MAKINFAALVDSIIGKLGGSVFQYSQGGWQVHVIGKPRNPQTNYQQLRRGNFGFLSGSWRNLTTIQRQSFIDNVPARISALDFFIRTNVNLTLVDEPIVTTFVPAVAPTDFPVEITDVNPTQYMIKASGMTTVVPAGMKLLIYTTSTKAQTKLFTNPSEYSPVISLDEGTDLSIPINIIASYNDRFGQLPGEMYLCNKTVLIDKSNGQRGTESIICSNTEDMATKYIPLHTLSTPVASVATGLENLDTFTVPANTLQSNGDRLHIEAFFSQGASVGLEAIVIEIDGTAYAVTSNPANSLQNMRIELIRKNAATANIKKVADKTTTSNVLEVNTAQAIDFTSDFDIKFQSNSGIAGRITLTQDFIDLIKAP